MWELDHKESWGRRINAFELWCWRRLLRVLDCKEIHPVNPKEIIPEYSLEGLMLKLQYFGHLIWRADSLQRPWCWERLKVGAEGDGRRWAGCMASPIWWTWVWVGSRSWWWIGKHAAVRRVAELDMTQWLNWIDPVLLVALPLSIPVNNNFREVHYSSDSQGSPFRLLSGILPWS